MKGKIEFKVNEENISFNIHPLCMLFPWMDAKTINILKDDIEIHGQRDSIKIFQGEVLDGKNRLRACADLGITPKVEDLTEDTNLIAYIKSVGLCRRDLNSVQRIEIAQAIEKYNQSQLPKEEQEKRVELKKDPIKREKFKESEIKRITIEARTTRQTVENVMKIQDQVKEGNPEAIKTYTNMKESKITPENGFKKVMGTTRVKPTYIPTEPSKEELRQDIIKYEFENLRLNNIVKRLIEFIKEKGLWSEIKHEFGFIENQELTEPTPKQLREAEK